MKIGFTGTHHGMNDFQKHELTYLLNFYKKRCDLLDYREFHHGDCIGADFEAAVLAEAVGFVVVSHPPIKAYRRGYGPYNIELPAKEYIARDHDIVNESDVMIATPYEDTEIVRSGTWTTIRYAKKKNKELYILTPTKGIYTFNE